MTALLAAASLGLAGCGGSGHKSAAPTAAKRLAPAPLSQSAFAARGNAICTAYYRKLNAGPKPTSPARLVAYLQRGEKPTRLELDQLLQLQSPARDRTALRQYVALGRRELSYAPALIAAARARSQTKLTRLIGTLARIDARANSVAKSIGLHVCGQATSSVSK